MQVCTAKQMAAIDAETIASGIPGIELMERAGSGMAGAVATVMDKMAAGTELRPEGPRALILAGKGNNGGDGLVVARHLAEMGLEVAVLLLCTPGDLEGDPRTNFLRLPDAVQWVASDAASWTEDFWTLAEEADLLVDAVFGTGITPPVRAAHAELFEAVNASGVPCVALDIPSGVCGDDGAVDPVAIQAGLTLTVGLPKLGLLVAPGRDFSGQITVVDIGFPEEICAKHAGPWRWLPAEVYAEMLPFRTSTMHKYECGRVGLVAGSSAYGGAAHLAGLGALRSGAGLVKLAVPMGIETAIRSGLPEAVVFPCAQTENGTLAPGDGWIQEAFGAQLEALGIGPGLDGHPDTDTWVRETLGRWEGPVVVDADALGAFSRAGLEIELASDQAVLTPHAGELARLIGADPADVQARRLELAGELASRWGAILVLKGSPTVIGTPSGEVFVNPTGDDSLARGGSGDVLTGLITGLLAQGLTALEAALLGSYLHGRAGSLASGKSSRRSILVREVADQLGEAFSELEGLAG